MSRLDEIYLGVYDYLKTLIEGITDGNGVAVFKEVTQGWKTRTTERPAALILPHPDAITCASTASDKHTMRFVIVSTTEDQNVSTGVRTAFTCAGRIHKAIVDDRQLNGKVYNTEVLEYSAEWGRGRMRGYVRHSVSLTIECYKLRTD